MKTNLLTALLLFVVLGAKAQLSNAILFTENGEPFQVVLNGVLQNAKPETNVKMTGLPAPNYKARIVFADKKLGYVDFNLVFLEPRTERTFTIKKNKKGEYVVRFVSEVLVAQAPLTPASQTEIVYTTIPAEETTTTVSHTTTTTSTGTANPDNVNISMGVNMGGEGGNMNINMSGMDGTATGSSNSTTTTTTTHTRTTTGSSAPPATERIIYVEGYDGPIGCHRPMSKGDFAEFKSSVSSKSFEDSKLTIAKQVLNNNCLTSGQVRETMQLFTFEQSKLDFAKYAYGYTYDVKNYYKVNDAFQFESSIDELNTYISGQR